MKVDGIRKVAILGAGTMGSGIALSFAQSGFELNLYDIKKETLADSLDRIKTAQEVMVREKMFSSASVLKARHRIHPTCDLKTALKRIDFVLETAPENLQLKQELLGQVDLLCPTKTIFATNTSGLSITKIALACRNPKRVAGMHWVNPPHLVPLVEVIRGAKTSDSTAMLISQLTRKLGKIPVIIHKEVPGFGVNRLQFALFREALHMIDSGVVSAEDLDKIMKFGLGFRYPWIGPIETADLGGLDVFHSIATYLYKELSAEQKPPDSFIKLISQNNLGVKTGRGFYPYPPEVRQKVVTKRDICFIRQWKLMKEVAGEDE